ncbi:hydroxymethylglutaryl-CoA reductase, degradative [Globomyces pollinis-pini]|nr:hydroxymethylglutaryl-CoA reductase, degradative [Globomyces pollinis-pini]
MPTTIWSGFRKKTLKERLNQVKSYFRLSDIPSLDTQTADNMIENCIGTMAMPLGLALNLNLNNRPCIIPMVVEEPSVVAAVSGAAKLISANGGFITQQPTKNIIYSQVQLLDILDSDLTRFVTILTNDKDHIVSLANALCPSMVKRGGGVVDMSVRIIKKSNPTSKNSSQWLVIHFHIDVCDAMGANIATTVAEGMAPYLANICNARIGFRIVSNLATERISKAKFKIPISSLDYKGFTGLQVAERIIEAYEWAKDDPYRAVTHNKGIMNGIDAVAVATGQDWRAIEAASHAWASLKNPTLGYQPLTEYWIEQDDSGIRFLVGELCLPICVGTQGGVLKTNPSYQYALSIMENPTSKQLAISMVAVGLAQNFAALRALATEGIQKGHMALHARNIAISVGAPNQSIGECVAHMIETNQITQMAAKEYLEAKRLLEKITGHEQVILA